MGGIRLSLDRRKLILDAVTQVINRSFNNLTAHRKRRFVEHFQNSSSDIDFEELKLERKLWDVNEREDGSDRIMIRCDIANRKLDEPKIFAKAGLTRKIESKHDYGLAVSYGWNGDLREAGFEKNVVMEMNRATEGVKIYYSTPGEKAALGKLRRPTTMRSYLDS